MSTIEKLLKQNNLENYSIWLKFVLLPFIKVKQGNMV